MLEQRLHDGLWADNLAFPAKKFSPKPTKLASLSRGHKSAAKTEKHQPPVEWLLIYENPRVSRLQYAKTVVPYSVLPAGLANSQTQTHATLLARLADGGSAGSSGAAWREFVDRYGELVRAVCRRHGLQVSDTDDVLQDVLLSLSKSMPGFTYDPSIGRFRSYLKTVVLHAIYKKSRQKPPAINLGSMSGGSTGLSPGLGGVGGAAATVSDDPAEDAQWEQEWRQHHLRHAMRIIDAEFSARDRTAFERYAVMGENAESVAQDAGVSIEALYQIKSRITKRLGQLIEAQVMEEG